MHLSKVLVAAPTARSKDYCFDAWRDQVMGFTYPNFMAYMVDNSGDDYAERINAAGIECDSIPKIKNPALRVLKAQEMIRRKALDGGFDFLLMLESDVFVRPDVIEYMISHGHLVHNITYFVNLKRFDMEPSLCLQRTHVNRENQQSLQLTPEGSFNIFDGKTEVRKKHGGTYQSHSGLGCSLIHRSVLEQVPFRIDLEHDLQHKQTTFADSYFHEDLNKKGIQNYINSEYIAQHNNSWSNYKSTKHA